MPDTTTDPDPDLAIVREVRQEFEELLEEARRSPFPVIPKLRLAYSLGQSVAAFNAHYRERIRMIPRLPIMLEEEDV